MKTFIGEAKGPGPGRVVISEPGAPRRRLTHRMRHSLDGFRWGYEGSGPADLALSLLHDVLGKEPPPAMYQAFKSEVIAKLPFDKWSLHETVIRSWIKSYELELAEPAGDAA